VLVHHHITKVVGNYIERRTGITTDELVTVSQNHDSNSKTTTKQFLIT